jgi:hypothetical protein
MFKEWKLTNATTNTTVTMEGRRKREDHVKDGATSWIETLWK